jgi:predicted nucleotide-binding protein
MTKKADAIRELRELAEEGSSLTQLSGRHNAWRRTVRLTLDRIFGPNSDQLKEFNAQIALSWEAAILESMAREIEKRPGEERTLQGLQVKENNHLTNEDKLAILKRLIKRIKEWRLQKSLPIMILMGKPTFSKSSPEFLQWLEDANEGITVVFGKYSHWLSEFNDIEYQEMRASLLGDNKANEANLWKGLDRAQLLLEAMIEEVQTGQVEASVLAKAPVKSQPRLIQKSGVFIGHGRSPFWIRVKTFLEEECGLRTVSFESEPRASESVVPILEQMLDQSVFAVIVLTAEDATADGHLRARQNVVHETGLSQGKLGFKRVVILKQEGVEELTNLAGLQYISFKDRIENAFYDLGKVLKREGLL